MNNTNEVVPLTCFMFLFSPKKLDLLWGQIWLNEPLELPHNEISKNWDISGWFSEKRPSFVKYRLWDANNKSCTNKDMYLFREQTHDVLLLNFIFFPPSLLDYNKVHAELEFIVSSYAGLLKRKMLRKREVTKDDLIEDLRDYGNIVNRFYHWQIFNERSLVKGQETVNPQQKITAAIILKLKLNQSKYYCPNCGKIYSVEVKSSEELCDCGAKLYLHPPEAAIDSVAFAFDEKILPIYEQLEVTPSELIEFVTNALLENTQVLMLDALMPGHFAYYYPLPVEASYVFPKTQDRINVSIKPFVDGKNVVLFAIISDTRSNLPDLIPFSLTSKIFMTMETIVGNNFNHKEALGYTELENWKVTDYYDIKHILNVQSLEKLL